MRKNQVPTSAQLLHRVKMSPKDAQYAVNWVKHNGDTTLINTVLENIIDTPNEHLALGDDPFPKNYSNIHSHHPRLGTSEHWETELQWNLYILTRYSAKLKKYVELRGDFGKAFLLGDYCKAENILDEVENSVSKSLWSLDKRFLLAQYHHGFTRNKNLLQDIHESCTNQYINLIALHYSIRVEHAIDYASYQSIVSSKMQELGKRLSPPVQAYIHSLIGFPPHLSRAHYSYILYRCNDASMIDRLNGVCRFLLSAINSAEGRADLQRFSKKINKLAESTLEPTLNAITKFLYSDRANITLPPDYGDFLDAIDSYTEGDYDQCIRKMVVFIASNPAAFSPYVVAAKAIAHTGAVVPPIGEPQSVSTAILSSLTAVMSGGNSQNQSLSKLISMASNLGENHLAFSIEDFVLDMFGIGDRKERAVMCALSGKFPEPAMECVIEDRSKMLDQLMKQFPNSSTLLFLKAKSEKKLVELNDQLKVHPRRLEFYQALEKTAKKEDDGIEMLARLYEEEKHTSGLPFVGIRQCAVALYNEYLERKSLIKASELVLDCYKRSSLLAASLATGKLLESFEDNPPPAGNGEILIPIVTSISVRDEFNIYKSLDRFLKAHSCKRMSDILELSSAFTEDRFRMLIGEVMSEDVMAQCWRFAKDFADVEEQRIALCAHLATFGNEASAIYAEEAKSITKRRSIRNALKYVGASKLRIDVHRMKKIYEQQAQPHFERARIFILAENEGNLEQIGSTDLISKEAFEDTNICDEDAQRPKVKSKLARQSQELLDLLFAICYGIYLWDADCALNFLLSADVRHGFLKNHLREPFQADNIILSKSAAEGEYQLSKAVFRDIRDSAQPEELQKLEEVFRSFSAKVDGLIYALVSRDIQIKIGSEIKERFEGLGLEEKLKGTESGMLDYEVFFQRIKQKEEMLRTVDTFEVFADLCFGELQSITEEIFSRIRNYFRTDVAQALKRFCDELAEGVKSCTENPSIRSTLIKKIQSARDNAVIEAEQIGGWFQSLKSSDPQETSLIEIVEIVVDLIKRCNPNAWDSCPVKCINEADMPLVRGAAFSATFDIIYILLQNVAEHAGLNADCVECEIVLNSTNELLVLEISNNVINESTATERVTNANRLIQDRTGLEASGEERSGLRKIHRIIRNAVGQPPFEFKASHLGNRFKIKVVLPSECSAL